MNKKRETLPLNKFLPVNTDVSYLNLKFSALAAFSEYPYIVGTDSAYKMIINDHESKAPSLSYLTADGTFELICG